MKDKMKTAKENGYSENEILDFLQKKYPLLRQPYKGELEYFKSNPNVAGMATEDNKIIFNPYSPVIPNQQQNIYRNEAARLYMKNKKINPSFELTPKQEEAFKSYGSPLDIKETILARILSGDESALDFTKEQQNLSKNILEGMIKEGWIDN